MTCSDHINRFENELTKKKGECMTGPEKQIISHGLK